MTSDQSCCTVCAVRSIVNNKQGLLYILVRTPNFVKYAGKNKYRGHLYCKILIIYPWSAQPLSVIITSDSGPSSKTKNVRSQKSWQKSWNKCRKEGSSFSLIKNLHWLCLRLKVLVLQNVDREQLTRKRSEPSNSEHRRSSSASETEYT